MSPSTIAPGDLERLGAVLLRGLDLHPGDPAVLVRVGLPDGHRPGDPLHPDDELVLAIADVGPGGHPLDVLVGAHVPDEWAAFGVVSVGTVRLSAQPALVGTRVRTIQLVERGGAWTVAFTTATATADVEPTTIAGRPGPTEPNGLVDDALRRALRLPTPPPDGDTLALFARQWLDRLVDECAGLDAARLHGCSIGWALSRHPAVGALGLGPVDERRLVAEGVRLATWRDWPQLRRMCAAATWSHPEIDPATAAWLDDGAFSRWAVACWPDPASLLQVLDALLPARTAEVVRRTVEAWHLPVADIPLHTSEHIEII